MSPEIYVLIGIIINTVGLVTVAVLNYRSNKKVETKVEEVRHATNSMKDALVKGALREGEQVGKDKQIALQEEIKKGVENATD